MGGKTRKTGISILSDVPWGTHFCHFYQTKEDLIDILVPYFKVGLENNEFCMWITSKPLSEKEAKKAMREALPDFDRYLRREQIEIVPHEEWYLKENAFNSQRVLKGWVDKHNQASDQGFDGLRLTGNTFWLEKKDWRNFAEYEKKVNNVIGKYRMMAICSYPLDKCGASEVIDVVANHQLALLKREGKWELIESPERKRAEEALKESETKYKTIVENVNDALIIHDLKGKILDVNQNTSKLFGCKRDKIVGKNISKFATKYTVKQIEPHMKQLTQKGAAVWDSEAQKSDGSIFPVNISAKVVSKKGKGIIQSFVRDITERKQAEKDLKLSELRFRSFIEQTTDAVFCYEYDPPIPTNIPIEDQIKSLYRGILVECNDVCAKSYGASRAEEVIGKKLTENFGIDPGSIDELFRTFIQNGYQTVDEEGVEVLDDGSERYFLNNGHGFIENDMLIRIWGTFRDITEQKQAEMALQKSGSQFRAVFENSPTGIIIINPKNSQFIDFNKAFSDMLGYSRSELLNLTVKEITHPDDFKIDLKEIQRLLSGEVKSVSREKRYIKKTGEIAWGNLSVTLIQAQEGHPAYGLAVVEDITERKRAEEALRASEGKYRSLFENMLEGFAYCKIIVDKNNKPVDFEYIDVNNAFEKLTGLKKEQVTGKRVTEAIPGIKKAHPELFKIYGKVALTGKATNFDIYFEPLKIWLSISVYCPKRGYFVAVFDNITERKRAEEALRESEEKYRDLVENLNDIIYATDKKGVLTYISPVIQSLAGYKPSELIGRSFTEFIHKQDLPRIVNQFQKVISGHIEPSEYRLLTKSGGVRWVRSSSRPIYKGKHIIGLQGVIADITERKQAEEVLKASEENYRAIFESVNDAIMIHDVKTGRPLDTNPKMVELLGYGREELAQMKIGDWTAGDPTIMQKEAVRRLKEATLGKPQLFEWRVKRKDSKLIWVEVNLKSAVIKGQKCVLAVVRDITERKQTEEMLKESEEKFRQFFENEPAYCYMISPEGLILDVNKSACMTLGYKKEELVGKDLKTIYAPEYLPNMRANLVKWKKTGKLRDKEIMIITKDGKRRIVLLSAAAVRNRAGKILHSVSVQKDITDRKQAEEELESSREQLRNLAAHLQSIREEERRLMAREIHDELGQSLTALKMDLFWLDKRMPIEQKPLLKKTKSMSKLIDKTVQRIKKISAELRPGLLDYLGLPAAIEWEGEEFQNRAGIKCEVNTDSEDIILDQDRSTALFRIFQEALTNAARHSNATGVKVSLKEKAGKLELRMRDNGKGITEKQISDPKSFGLIGMRERAQFLGGEVKIRGVQDKGTTIIAAIPLPKKGKT